jgi:hypothetical protein
MVNWEVSIKETKVHIEMQCHPGRRRKRRGRRRRRGQNNSTHN